MQIVDTEEIIKYKSTRCVFHVFGLQTFSNRVWDKPNVLYLYFEMATMSRWYILCHTNFVQMTRSANRHHVKHVFLATSMDSPLWYDSYKKDLATKNVYIAFDVRGKKRAL